MWSQARHGSLSPGDPAPDFTVNLLETKKTVQLMLSPIGGRPFSPFG
jgi:hypothetical protein